MNWVYSKNSDNSARFTLGVEAKNVMFCFGINPSTAKPNKLDNTLKSVVRIAERHDYDGWLMLNVYPQRATNPKDLHMQMNVKLHEANLKHIERALQTYRGHIQILAAWGTLINKRKYLKDCLKDIYYLFEKYDCEWVCVGQPSKAGHPHHPLYISNSERLKPFLIKQYIQTLLC